MYGFKLTVQDILSRDSFKDAKVIAGAAGVDRQVKWTHILETKEFESLINGDEMILTTGVGLQLDRANQVKFVKRLIEKNVTCICIELGSYFKDIPTEIIELANASNFPVIVFEKVVKFVDITQDLHTFIINRHHQLLSQLDTLSRKFNVLSLTPNGILKILQELHQYFQQNTLFITDEAKSYYYPSEIKDLEADIRAYIESSSISTEQKLFTLNEQTFALIPVTGLGQTWGHLCLEVKQTLSTDFSFLILDRAALAIAQILLRNRTIEERKQNAEDELVRNLVKGRFYEQEDLHTYLPSTSRNMHFRVFVIQLDFPKGNIEEKDWEEIKLQRSMMVRSLFKRHGFFPAVAAGKKEITVISSFLAAEHLRKETDRFRQIIQSVRGIDENNFLDGSNCTFGVSMVYKEINQIKTGYEEAKEVLKISESGTTKTHFYEELGIYRLLLLLKNSNSLDTYVNDYLSELLEYDRQTDSDLFTTLSIYLQCGGVKKETADRLFIVRQTLYHRLERLETLLGENFMDSSNRLALEVAIKAYKLLQDDYSITRKADIAP